MPCARISLASTPHCVLTAVLACKRILLYPSSAVYALIRRHRRVLDTSAPKYLIARRSASASVFHIVTWRTRCEGAGGEVRVAVGGVQAGVGYRVQPHTRQWARRELGIGRDRAGLRGESGRVGWSGGRKRRQSAHKGLRSACYFEACS